jgi:3-hydroxyisobutyrate dehydrogenase-like beta-hydroxyacid dehydrogenase
MPDRCAALGALGGQSADPAAVWATGTVLIAVFDAGQAQQVIEAAPQGGAALALLHVTCAPEAAEALERRAEARGISLVEAPVSGTSGQLRRGEATLFLGGRSEAVARAAPTAALIGRRVIPVGRAGNGARVKLAVNLVLGLNRAALAEGLVLAEALGIDAATALGLFRESAAQSAVMAEKGRRMVEGDFNPEGRVAQSAKDFALILSGADAAGQDLPFARTYAAMMADCIGAGEGDLDNAAIIAALRRRRRAGG